jgi:hypothetical protein
MTRGNGSEYVRARMCKCVHKSFGAMCSRLERFVNLVKIEIHSPLHLFAESMNLSYATGFFNEIPVSTSGCTHRLDKDPYKIEIQPTHRCSCLRNRNIFAKCEMLVCNSMRRSVRTDFRPSSASARCSVKVR